MKNTTLFGILTAATLATATSFVFADDKQPKAQHEQRPAPALTNVGQEQIEGKIVAVDKTKGTLSVETQQHGQLEFKLTQAQVQKLSEGDQVRLQIQIHSLPKQP